MYENHTEVNRDLSMKKVSDAHALSEAEFYKKMVVALDLTPLEAAQAIVLQLGDRIEWYKVGPILFSLYGPSIVSFLKEHNKKILLDLKLHDTPRVVGETIKQLGDIGVDMVTLHFAGGEKMLEAASRHCRGFSIKLLGIPLLTSVSVERPGWHCSDVGEASPSSYQLWLDHCMSLVREIRLAGLVCSSFDLPLIGKRPQGFTVMTPGIRRKDFPLICEDQQRIATPYEALKMGSDYLIVGRPIIQARDPRSALFGLYESLRENFLVNSVL